MIKPKGYTNTLYVMSCDDEWLATMEPARRVTDDDLRAAFAHVLRPETPDDKFRLALQLFAAMEADR